MKKLLFLLSLIQKAFMRSVRSPIELLGTAGFYLMILYIFSNIWTGAIAKDESTQFRQQDMIWYLTIAEWIMISIPMGHIDIHRDILQGNFSYLNLRPVPYTWIKICEGIGLILSRMLCLGFAGTLFTYALTRELPSHSLWIILLGFPAMVMGFLFYVAIGMCSFWLWDPGPLALVWQKGLFLFGGLIFPLTIYPPWLRSISEWTPFSAMIYEPARLVLLENLDQVGMPFLKLLAWSSLAFGCVHLFSYLGSQRVARFGD